MRAFHARDWGSNPHSSTLSLIVQCSNFLLLKIFSNSILLVSILISSIGSLKRPLSGAHYPGISSIMNEPPVLSAGQDCILNNIDTVHSSLTYISYVKMLAEPIIPQRTSRHSAPLKGRFKINSTIYPGDNGNFLRAPEVFHDTESSLFQLNRS